MASVSKKRRFASHADRDEAESVLRRHHQEGRLDDDQLQERLSAVRGAKTLADLQPVYAGLPKRFDVRGAENKLASDADREEAGTKLNQHHQEGRIQDDEFEARRMRARGAQTQSEIDDLVKDLPSLDATLRSRLPGNAHKRADNAQRNAAKADLGRHYAAGRLSQEEFTRRTIDAGTADTPASLAALLSDLPKLGPSGNVRPTLPVTNAVRRASDDDRSNAIRKLRVHRDRGDLTPAECETRSEFVAAATTLKEIDQAFADLKRLTPQRQPGRERLVSDADRRSAVEYLDDDLVKGRIEHDEHESRVEQVYAARSREEIEAAFRSLTLPRMRKGRERAEGVVVDVVGRTKSAFYGWVRAVAAFVISIIILAAVDMPARLAGVVVMIGSIILFVGAVRSLVNGKAR